MKGPDRRNILVVLHQEHSTPGRVGVRLVERGYRLDIRRPRFGDPLPDTLSNHAGAVVFGGPMSANDPEDYISRETDWMRVPLDEQVPFLGLCLGAQMLAKYLGAPVTARPDGLVEVGYYPLRATDAGRSLFTWPDRVHHFHNEGFDLPAGATLLAEGELFRNQAFAFGGTAYAIQFHVELTNAMVGRWTRRMHERPRPGMQPAAEHFAGRALYDWQTARFLEAFLDHWLSTDQRT